MPDRRPPVGRGQMGSDPVPPLPGESPEDHGGTVARRVRRLRVENGELKSSIAKLRSDHDRLAASVLAADARGPGEGGESGDAPGSGGKFVERPGFEEAVRAVVDRYATEAKFREALKKA